MDIGKLIDFGLLTHQTRIESWECDYNDHWNVRYYIRSFQMASAFVAAQTGTPPESGKPRTRHIRYHGELPCWATARIRSCVIETGEFEGAVLHILCSQNRLAASVLERFDGKPPKLPAINDEDAAFGLPRGLDGTEVAAPAPTADTADLIPLGYLDPLQFDHHGKLMSQEVSRYLNVLSHGYLDAVGFTPVFRKETSISLMTVETKITSHADCTPGTFLMGRTTIDSVARKSFRLRQDLFDLDNRCLYSAQDVLLSTSLITRKSVENPPFVAQYLQ